MGWTCDRSSQEGGNGHVVTLGGTVSVVLTVTCYSVLVFHKVRAFPSLGQLLLGMECRRGLGGHWLLNVIM